MSGTAPDQILQIQAHGAPPSCQKYPQESTARARSGRAPDFAAQQYQGGQHDEDRPTGRHLAHVDPGTISFGIGIGIGIGNGNDSASSVICPGGTSSATEHVAQTTLIGPKSLLEGDVCATLHTSQRRTKPPHRRHRRQSLMSLWIYARAPGLRPLCRRTVSIPGADLRLFRSG